MTEASRYDAWQAGDGYEAYMGRWSRQLVPRFLDWFGAEECLDWLDVGCATAALSAAILAQCNPKNLISIDPSEGFIVTAPRRGTNTRMAFDLSVFDEGTQEPFSVISHAAGAHPG